MFLEFEILKFLTKPESYKVIMSYFSVTFFFSTFQQILGQRNRAILRLFTFEIVFKAILSISAAQNFIFLLMKHWKSMQ